MSLVRFEIMDESYGVLTLDRADKFNALSMELLEELSAKIAEVTGLARAHRIRAVVLESSTRKAFCAGADLKERMAMTEIQVGEALDRLRSVMDGIAGIPVPTIAAVEGIAFGGGLELALACDLRIASNDAQMGLIETKLAIIPGAGGTQRLARTIGLAKAKELIFRGTKLSGAEALSIGLVNWIAADPREVAHGWAREITDAGPVALQAAKRALDFGVHLDLAAALDLERACYDTTLSTEDRLEGLAAFSEKRKAVYKGA